MCSSETKMTLDIITIFVSLSTVNFFLIAILTIFLKTQKTYDGFAFWVLAQVFLSINFILLALRGKVDDFFSIIIGNYFFALAGVLLLFGVRKFFGRGKNILPVIIIPIIFTAVIVYYLYFDNSFFARTCISAAYSAIISIMIAVGIFRFRPDKNKYIYFIPAFLFLIHAGFISTRAFIITTQHLISGIIDNNNLNTVFFLFLMVLHVGINVTFIMWNHSRLSAELEFSNIELSDALNEKEILIREMNHRTKNNLQIIISMIRIKRGSVDGDITKNVLGDIENRIKTLSLVYQKLFSSRSITRIPADEYLSELSSLIITAFHREKTIELKTDMERINVQIDNAVSLGIVLNELITNILKHAFDDHEPGILSLQLRKTEPGKVMFSVSDNGRGIPEHINPERSPSFGLHIVYAVIQNQLGGTILLNRNSGTEWIVSLDDNL